METHTGLLFCLAVGLIAVTVQEKGDFACDSQIYCHGPLLDKVQRSGLFPDSKTFVDMQMKTDPQTILQDFADLPGNVTKEELGRFVEEHFSGPGGELEEWTPPDWVEEPSILADITDPQLRNWAKKLNELWKVLGRKIKPIEHEDRHSLIPVPKPFVIPGDRFREFYYWDTYWIVGGLLAVDMDDTVKGVLENFIEMVSRFGFVPNGGRIYYTRRSQPPLLIPMVDLYIQHSNNIQFLQDNIDTLEKEYDFWIKNRTVAVGAHQVAQYKVETSEPRPEGYMPDVEVIEGMSEQEASVTLSHIVSACESGWDFSTKWFADKQTLKTIQTQNIVPVELNVYLCWCEQLLAKFYDKLGNEIKKEEYTARADDRKSAIDALFWNNNRGAWFDYNLETQEQGTEFYPSNIFPLFAECTNIHFKESSQAQAILSYIKSTNVTSYPGGIPTSLIDSGQQWDYPNAWSPLVQLMIASISKLPLPEAQKLAKDVASNWVLSNHAAWKNYGHMYEKYNVEKFGYYGSGGEYGIQIGFGWTNGVNLMLLKEYGGDLVVTDSASPNKGNTAAVVETDRNEL